MRIVKLDEASMKNILADMLKRDPNNYDAYTETVQEIVDRVKAEGDAAVFDYTKKFDKAEINADNIRVTEAEIKEAMEAVDPHLLEVMKKSMENIRRYHEKQRRNSWFDSQPDGTILGQKITALESAVRLGVKPAVSSLFFMVTADIFHAVCVCTLAAKLLILSSVLMNIIPAEVAGVKRIVMVTPPGKDGKVNPVTLTAAHLAGATEVYKVGGAQAIAALAFGTESIPRVSKIVGPGNIFVALAKKAVYGHVSIDSIAGPSEILVVADETANPRYVAADLLSQAEHDELASAILVTTSMELAEKVSKEVDGFLQVLSRSEIIKKSLDNYGYILVVDTMDEAVETANNIAPEHLELVTANPFEVMTKIRNAGAIFIGEYSSEPWETILQDQTTSFLPTEQQKFFSPLGVDDFIKKSSIIYYSEKPLKRLIRTLRTLQKQNT